MRFEDLSLEDQRLLQTDLGEFEKEAAAELALADDMYVAGYEKLAAETADYLDQLYSMDKEASEEAPEESYLDDASEKTAHDLGSFIERGYFDGLRKLGSERYGDEMAYLYPFMEEKVAAAGASAAAEKFRSFGAAAKGHAGKAVEKAKEMGGKFKGYHTGAVKQMKEGVRRVKESKEHLKDTAAPEMFKNTWKGIASGGKKEVAKGALKFTPHAAAGIAATGYAVKKIHDKVKSEKTASEYLDQASAIDRSIVDGLMKMGAENYGDELAYILPLLEKSAGAAAVAAKAGIGTRVGDAAKKLWEGTKSYHAGAAKDIVGKGRLVARKTKDGLKGQMFGDTSREGTIKAMTGGEKAKSVARGALKFAPHAAVLGGGTYAATRKSGE